MFLFLENQPTITKMINFVLQCFQFFIQIQLITDEEIYFTFLTLLGDITKDV